MDFTNTGEYFEKDLSLEELIQFLYGLNYLEFEIFELLIIHKNLDSEALQGMLKRKDRVSINKTLRKFSQFGIIERKKNSLEGKPGYHYIYSVPNLTDLKNIILERYNNFHNATTEKLNLFDKHYELKFKK
jgi:predicted transcriptional regulator